MASIFDLKKGEYQFPNRWRVSVVNKIDENNSIVDMQAERGAITTQGSEVKALDHNIIQQNGVIFSKPKYSADFGTGIDGYVLDDFHMEQENFTGLKLKLEIDTTNLYDNPQIQINEEKFELKWKSGEITEGLKKDDLKQGYSYNVYYDGLDFIVENSNLPMRDDRRGTTSGLDMRMGELLNILGLDYGGNFGTDLTSIEADKVYYYKDPVTGRATPYVALASKSGTFITPDVDNFKSLTNRDNLFYKKLNITLQTTNGVILLNAYIFGNLLIVNGFISDPTPFNNATAGTELVNIAGMIPEIKDYGVFGDSISAINLVIKSNFALAKSTSNVSFYSGQHFTVLTGLYKGTIR